MSVQQTRSRSSTGVVERRDATLACVDLGPGDGPPIVLLHGLAGHVGEWRATAEALAPRYRVVAFDQRAHGASTRAPGDVSRGAFVDDAVAVIEELGVGRCVLMGQALGGHTAFLVAAERPDLVAGLVVAETSPECDPSARDRLAVLMRAWPVPFPSQAAALEFFGGDSPAALAWLEGLELRDGGWWPRFDRSTVLDALVELTTRSFWREWDGVRAPTLVVRGELGALEPAVAEQMLARSHSAGLVEILGSGPDVHLEQPASWLEAVVPFIASIWGR